MQLFVITVIKTPDQYEQILVQNFDDLSSAIIIKTARLAVGMNGNLSKVNGGSIQQEITAWTLRNPKFLDGKVVRFNLTVDDNDAFQFKGVSNDQQAKVYILVSAHQT